MDIIACIKQIYDLARIRADADSRPLTEGVQKKLSDFDRNALEESVRIKEKQGGSVLALVRGTKDAAREALAMGADEACVYDVEADSLATASMLAGMIRERKYDLILCGEASIDEYSFQIGPRIAQILGIPLITYARKIELSGGEIIAERDLENRYEVAKAKLPALVTVTKEINEPRIPTLIQIIGASKKKMTEIRPQEQEQGVLTLNVKAVEMKRKEVILKDVEELAKVIVQERK